MKIALTGKPGVGKTALTHIMEREFPHKVLICADAIDILKAGGFPEPQSSYDYICRQKALYHLQVELENLTTNKAKDRIVLCDNGTLDCLNFWPESPQSFFSSVQTTLEKELERYDWVIQIATSQKNTSQSTSVPYDSQYFWKLHPHVLVVPPHCTFSECYTDVARIIHQILNGQQQKDIVQNLSL